MFHRILVCLDHSKLDEQVLPYAMAEARRSASKIVLLHVCKKDFKSFDLPASGYVSFVPIELILREFAQRWSQTRLYLRGIADRLAGEGIDAEPVVIEGIDTVAEAIRTYAQENAIDLIAMASRGRRGLLRFVLGSVAASVARTTTIPVLVVKPGGEPPEGQEVLVSADDTQDLEGDATPPVWQEGLDQGPLTV